MFVIVSPVDESDRGFCFDYICFMKAMVITTKDSIEYKFVADLLKKLGVSSSAISSEELEDIGLSKMMKEVDKSKKVSRQSIMKKLGV